MFLIGEFSKLTQVTIRMLRYYDEMGLLKPNKVDPWTGYRMYSVEQIPALNKIIYLRDCGFNVAEIAASIQQENETLLTKQLDKKQEEILRNIETEKTKLNKIQLAKKEILQAKGEMHYQITIKSIPSYQVLSLRKVIPNYYEEGKLWAKLSEYASKQEVEYSDNSFSIYYDEDYREEMVEVELCAPVKKMGRSSGEFHFRLTEPVPIMASTMVYGDFSHIGKAYVALATWLQDNSEYQMISPSRQIVHRGPWNEEDPKQYLTEIQIPLKTR